MDDVTLDLEQKDYQLSTQPALAHSDQVHLADLHATESDRIQRTARTAADSIVQSPQTRFNDKLNGSKLSAVPAVADKVIDATRGANFAQTAQDIPGTLNQLTTQREILADDTIPLPDDADAKLTELLGPKETVAEKKGFLIQINELVADIMELIAKLNDRDRQKTDHMKKDYGKLNNEIGDAISNRGTATFWSNVGAFFTRVGATVVGAAIGSDVLQKTGDMLGQQIPGLTGILTTGYEVTQTKASNRLSLLSTDMQSTSQKSGDNSGLKNELIQSLNDMRQWMAAAARAN